jgi:hypothetical protein
MSSSPSSAEVKNVGAPLLTPPHVFMAYKDAVNEEHYLPGSEAV